MQNELPPELQILWNKIVKKHYKLNVVSSKNDIVGNSLATGNPGFCKTSGDRRESEIRYAKNHKIFFLYDSGRMDMAFQMFKSISPFWKKPKLEGKRIVSARAYPVVLLYPVTKNIPKKLPYNAVPFTIGVNDLDENDFTALVGDANKDSIKSAINSMSKYVNNNTNPIDYLNILGKSMTKSFDLDKIKINSWSIKRLKGDAFLPLMNEGLLTSSSSEYAINLRDCIKDKKTIHILVLRHCPQSLWGFIVYYFMNHINKILSGIDTEQRISQKTTIVLNEVSDLLSTDAEMGSSSEAISSMISKIAKQWRTASLYMLLDTQVTSTLPSIKETMNRIYLYNSSLPEVQRCMEIMGISTRTGQITTDDLLMIPHLRKGWYYLLDRDSGVSLHKLVWTRSRTYEDGEDFYDVYNKVYGLSSYVNISPILDKLKKEREDSEKIWKLKNESEINKSKIKSKYKKQDSEEDEGEDEEENPIKEEIINEAKKEVKERVIKEVNSETKDQPRINGSEIKEEAEINVEKENKEVNPYPFKPNKKIKNKINYGALSRIRI